MQACIHAQSITPCRKMHARAYCVVHTPMCVCNSNGCFPVCQSSGSGDDITAQDGSGGRGGEGGAWHGVGRPPSSLSHGSLQKRAAAPEQRLRKRVRGSALLTPLLPHAQPLKSVFSSLLSLSTSCSQFPLICSTFFVSSLALFLAHPALFIIIVPNHCIDLLRVSESALCLQLV